MPAAQLQPLQNAMAALQAEYEVLARRASDLRSQQNDHVLTYRLVTGEDRRLASERLCMSLFPTSSVSGSVWGYFCIMCGVSL